MTAGPAEIGTAIVLNALGRGGSNLLMNMIASSPDVQLANREFWQFYYGYRNPAPSVFRRIDSGLGKLLLNLQFNTRRFKHRLADSVADAAAADLQGRKGRGDDRPPTALLFKVTGYDIFLNARIEGCFDKVKFVGLVRDGYGMCDSWQRRGTPAAMAGRMYAQIAGRMTWEARNRENYHLVRFEDILRDPNGVRDRLYRALGLSLPADGRYIERRKDYGPGNEASASAARPTALSTWEEWCENISGGVNLQALERLSDDAIADFNRSAAGVMTELDYAVVAPRDRSDKSSRPFSRKMPGP